MKTEVNLTSVKHPEQPPATTPTTVMMILGLEDPGRQCSPFHGSTATKDAPSDSKPHSDESARYRDELRRRHEAPFHSVWHYEGIS